MHDMLQCMYENVSVKPMNLHNLYVLIKKQLHLLLFILSDIFPSILCLKNQLFPRKKIFLYVFLVSSFGLIWNV